MKNIKLKMFGSYSISSFLYWLFKVLFIILIAFLAFFIISTLIGNYKEAIINSVTHYYYKAYFNETVFNVRMDTKGIISFVFPFLKNGLLFYLLVLIFKSLKKEQLIFTKDSIKYLRLFAIFNICMPFIYSLLDILMFNEWVYLNILPSMPNVFIGLFTLFVLAIFKQGFQVQQENDLTI